MRPPIGGFMPLERPETAVTQNVFDLWGVRTDNSWVFANGRSALAHLLRRLNVKRLLLPAFVCPELAAAAGTDIAVSYFALAPDLSPRTAQLDVILQPGDCVVAVDYFGRAPDSRFREFVTHRDDVVWVEDRAQAMAPLPSPWADWILYSPRKLFGVPDGGILVRKGQTVATPRYTGADVVAATAPRLMKESDGRFAAYRSAEENMRVTAQAMSGLSRRLLQSIDPEPAMRKRQENYRILAQMLSDFEFLRDRIGEFVPMGFPVRVANRDTVWRRLAAQGVYAARHWPALPSDSAAFPFEHELSRSLMTLPCDQRYDKDDMRHVATLFGDACA